MFVPAGSTWGGPGGDKWAGLGDEPRRIFEELGKISLVDVVLPTRSGVEIRRRYVRRPTDHQAILLERLGLALPLIRVFWEGQACELPRIG